MMMTMNPHHTLPIPMQSPIDDDHGDHDDPNANVHVHGLPHSHSHFHTTEIEIERDGKVKDSIAPLPFYFPSPPPHPHPDDPRPPPLLLFQLLLNDPPPPHPSPLLVSVPLYLSTDSLSLSKYFCEFFHRPKEEILPLGEMFSRGIQNHTEKNISKSNDKSKSHQFLVRLQENKRISEDKKDFLKQKWQFHQQTQRDEEENQLTFRPKILKYKGNPKSQIPIGKKNNNQKNKDKNPDENISFDPKINIVSKSIVAKRKAEEIRIGDNLTKNGREREINNDINRDTERKTQINTKNSLSPSPSPSSLHSLQSFFLRSNEHLHSQSQSQSQSPSPSPSPFSSQRQSQKLPTNETKTPHPNPNEKKFDSKKAKGKHIENKNQSPTNHLLQNYQNPSHPHHKTEDMILSSPSSLSFSSTYANANSHGHGHGHSPRHTHPALVNSNVSPRSFSSSLSPSPSLSPPLSLSLSPHLFRRHQMEITHLSHLQKERNKKKANSKSAELMDKKILDLGETLFHLLDKKKTGKITKNHAEQFMRNPTGNSPTHHHPYHFSILQQIITQCDAQLHSTITTRSPSASSSPYDLLFSYHWELCFDDFISLWKEKIHEEIQKRNILFSDIRNTKIQNTKITLRETETKGEGKGKHSISLSPSHPHYSYLLDIHHGTHPSPSPSPSPSLSPPFSIRIPSILSEMKKQKEDIEKQIEEIQKMTQMVM